MTDEQQVATDEQQITTDEKVVSEGPSEVSSRDEVYRKYYESQGWGSLYEEPKATEKVSNEGESTEEVSTESSPTESVSNEPPAQPSPLEQLYEEVKSLKESFQLAKEPTAPQPVEQQPKPVESAPSKTWIDYLREGDLERGEDALAIAIENRRSAQKIQEQQRIMEQTIEMLEAKNRMKIHADKLRREHPEFAPLEGLFNDALAHAIVQAKQEGRINTYKDIADVYVEKLNTFVESAKKIYQSSRADGANEAKVRIKEVVSSSVVRPNEVTEFGVDKPGGQDKPESTLSPFQQYILARRKQQARRDRFPQ